MRYARDTGAIATPIGIVTVTAEGEWLTGIRIGEGRPHRGSTVVGAALDQLEHWFAGDRRDFDLPLAPAASARGAALRQAIVDVGYGETATYGELARRYESAPRAVGQACARNPFPLIVPCHRVLAAGDRLGFYSGGDGPATKRWLLDFEAGTRRLL